MDTMPSTQFRKTYASLTDRTEVTVNGHVIGMWVPFGGAPVRQVAYERLVADEDVVDHGLGTPEQQAAAQDRIERGAADVTLVGGSFSSRPFTPVPKPGRR